MHSHWSSFFHPSRLEASSIFQSLEETKKFFSGYTLDIGCGERPYHHLAQEAYSHYIGVDMNISQTPPPDVCADALQLPFKDDTFDTVLCSQVIEHVEDPFRMVGEAARVLKPGGHLILTAPQVWPLHEEPRDFFRYTKYGLALIARKSDLTTLYIRERGGALLALGQLLVAVVYDKVKGKKSFRIPLKPLFAAVLALCRVLDKYIFLPKLTLGYVMVARKKHGSTEK
ncbi:MAG: hypothetical protein C4326_07805 [Ignavibacteria bacterium]